MRMMDHDGEGSCVGNVRDTCIALVSRIKGRKGFTCKIQVT